MSRDTEAIAGKPLSGADAREVKLPKGVRTGAGKKLLNKRIRHHIAGDVLCRKLHKSRSWLCRIERGYLFVGPDEFTRIDSALDDLIRAKIVLHQTAAALGWPGAEVA